MLKTFKSTIAILAMFFALIFVGATMADGGNIAYGAESGTCDVYYGETKIKDNVSVREAWDYCVIDYNRGHTIKLNSDVKLDSRLYTLLGEECIVGFDMNGYDIDCQNNTGAFTIYRKGTLNLFNSRYGVKESAIKNCDSTAIVSTGCLELTGITIKNCRGYHGGAINITAIRSTFVKYNDPHALIKNCLITNCTAEIGGGIYSDIEKISATTDIPDRYSDYANNYFGSTLKISNTTISYCTGQAGQIGWGGGLVFRGKCLLENSTIEHCFGKLGSGGINVGHGSELVMRNSKVNYNKGDDGPGGGIVIPDSRGGSDPAGPGKATIIGGEIIGNEGDVAGGILLTDVHGGAELTIGGDLVVKNNIDTSGKQRNIELTTSHEIQLTDQGLTSKAEVGVGTGKKGEEVVVGFNSNTVVAEQSALRMFPDHKNTQEAANDDVLGIYTYSGGDKIYMGLSRRMELLSFKLVGEGRANVKVTIDNEKNTITAKFPFKEGYWHELWEAEWYAGKPGSANEGRAYTQASTFGTQDHPLKSGTATRGDYEDVRDDYVALERNGVRRSWQIIFINEPGSVGKVIVENGILPGKTPEKSSTDTKKIYYLTSQDMVQLQADAAPSSKTFSHWEVGSEATTSAYVDDWGNPNANVLVPGNDKTVHLKAVYTDKKQVTVIGGTITNTTETPTVCHFGQGEEVKLQATVPEGKTFKRWAVLEGTANFASADAKKAATTSFKMGDNSEQGKLEYTDVTIKAIYTDDVDVQEPKCTKDSGTYQQTSLSAQLYLDPADSATDIYYRVKKDGSFTHYTKDSDIVMSLDTLQKSKKFFIEAYAVKTIGGSAIKSEVVRWDYELVNPGVKEHTVTIIGGEIYKYGKVVYSSTFWPGETVSINALKDAVNLFTYWEVVEGPNVFSGISSLLVCTSFTMPNDDVTIVGNYSKPAGVVDVSAVKGNVNGKKAIQTTAGKTVKFTTRNYYEEDGVIYTFSGWTIYADDEKVATSKRTVYKYKVPAADNVVGVANFTVEGKHSVRVVNGTCQASGEKAKTTGYYYNGEVVTIKAQKKSSTSSYEFSHWEVIQGDVKIIKGSLLKEQLQIKMGTEDIVIKAVFEESILKTLHVVNGKISGGSTIGLFLAGTPVTTKANPDIAGEREFIGWTGIGIGVAGPTTNTWNFNMPNNNATAIAKFKDQRLTTINGVNRKFDTTDDYAQSKLYEYKDKVEIKANIPSGYEFKEWVIKSAPKGFTIADKTKANTYVTMNPKGNVVLEATFTKKYNYSATNCTIKLSDIGVPTSSGVAKEGDTLIVTAFDGHTVDHWEAVGITLPSDLGNKESFTVTMPANDVSIMAVFKSDPPTTLYSLKVEQGHIGDEASRTCGVYGAGTSLTVTADNPAPDGMTGQYTFKEWKIVKGPSDLLDGQKTQETVSFEMPSQDVELKAVYNYTVSGAVIHGQLIKPLKLTAGLSSSVETGLKPGEKVKATASIASGMTFDHWDAYGIELSEAQKTDADINITVPENDFALVACYNLTPVLKNALYTENGTNVTKGSTDTPAKTGNYASGVEVDIVAVNPDSAKYAFDGWEIIKAPEGFTVDKDQASQTIVMPNGDVELRANFKEIKYNYTCTNCVVNIGSGAATVSGSAAAGTSLHVSRRNIDGADFEYWEINGVKQEGKALAFDYTMPAEDVTIKAVFKPVIQVLHTLVVNNGYIDADASKSVGTYGEGTKLTATAVNPDPDFNSQYVFEKWVVVKGPSKLLDGQTTNEIVSFTMPNEDVELKAVYNLRVNGYIVHGKFDKASMGLTPGETIKATADSGGGLTFDHWECYGVELTDDQKDDAVVNFAVPRKDFVLIACYSSTPITTHTLLTENGTNVTKDSGDTPAKIGTYVSGAEITITAVNPGTASGTADNYYFAGWEVVEAPDGFTIDHKLQTQTITMPNSDVVLRAVFKEYKYNIKSINSLVSIDNGANWTTFASVVKGTALKVKREMEGTFDHWEINDEMQPTLGEDESFNYTMPASDLIIKAVFKNERYVYNVVVNGGYIDDEPSSSIRTFGEGTKVKVTGINPTLDGGDKHYVFKEWQIVSGPSNLLGDDIYKETASFEMPNEYVELKAVYEPRVNGDIVRGVLSKTSHGLIPGESVTATAVAGSGMKFHHWTAIGFELPEGTETKDCVTFDVPDNNFVLIACYEESPVQVNTLLTENGTNKTYGGTETACKLGTYGSGTEVEITAINPAKGTDEEDRFVFMGWEVYEAPDGFTIADPSLEQQTIIMPEGDVVLHAWYAEKHLALGVKALINGQEEGYYLEGDTLSVTADPGAGMEFAFWTVQGMTLTKAQKLSAELEITMPDNDITLIANYKKIDLPIHNLSVDHGKIEGFKGAEARSVDLYDGSMVTVNADPAAGMTFGFWHAEGITLTHEERTDPELVVTMPSDPGNDVRVTAVYYVDYPDPHRVTVINGKITSENTSDDYYYQGSTVTVSADSKPGLAFKGWKAEGIELTEAQKNSANLTFEMPNSDVTLTAMYGVPTGDDSDINLYTGLGLIAVAGAATVLAARRKKED